MHGRTQVMPGASAMRARCEDCPLSPGFPVCTASCVAAERDIDILVSVRHRGERLFHHGERFDSVYMVRSGMFKTCTVSASGEEQVIGFHAPGDLLGLNAIHPGRHTSSAIALDTASTGRLPYEALCRLSARMPQMLRCLHAKMSERIGHDERRLGMLAMRGAGERMASFLVAFLDDCRRRGLQCDELLLPMRRADIASYLVLALETVSRSLSRHHEAKVIDVRRNSITILDEKALRRMAGEAHGNAPE